MSAILAFRDALIQRLSAAVPMVEGRVRTPPVPQSVPHPYLLIYDYSDERDPFYGQPGGTVGCNIRGVVRLSSGDTPLVTLWQQVSAALSDYELVVPNYWTGLLSVNYIMDYGEPTDITLRHFVARAEVIAMLT